MLKNKLFENTFWIIIIAITIFFSCKLGEYVNSKKLSTGIVQINYLNGGDKINTGLFSK